MLATTARLTAIDFFCCNKKRNNHGFTKTVPHIRFHNIYYGVTIIPYPKNDKENIVTIILSLGKMNGDMVTYTIEFW